MAYDNEDEYYELASSMLWDMIEAINGDSLEEDEIPFIDEALEDEFIAFSVSRVAYVLSLGLKEMSEEDINNICFHRSCFLENAYSDGEYEDDNQ